MLTDTWNNANHNDIFEIMLKRTGCTYISDLHHVRNGVMMEMSRIDLSGFDEKQVDDFAHYVFGIDYDELYELLDNKKKKDKEF